MCVLLFIVSMVGPVSPNLGVSRLLCILQVSNQWLSYWVKSVRMHTNVLIVVS